MAHKFCQSCEKEVISTMRVCPGCGGKDFSNEKNKSKTFLNPEKEVISKVKPTIISNANQKTRPWVRYWARMMDLNLFGFICGGLLGFLFPDYILGSNIYALGIEIAFLYMFVEPILLTEFGTTFGKWLFRIKISKNNGEKITYTSAFRRSYKVWWRALGLNVPLVSLVTTFVAYDKLVRNGATSWDVDEGFKITHERIGWLRISCALVLFVFYTLFIVSATAFEKDFKTHIWKSNINQVSNSRIYY